MSATNQPPGLELFQIAGGGPEIWDADGRPLVEDREELIERKRCPYPGIRHGRLMNVSALKQMGSHWEEILDGMAFLTLEHMTRSPQTDTRVLDWLRISSMAMALPHFLLNRSRDPVQNGQLPGSIASMFKAAADVTTTVLWMLARSFADGRVIDDVASGPRQVGEIAEETGFLVTGEEGACAGTPKLIEAFLSSLALPSARSRDVTSLRALVADPAAMLAYGDAFLAVEMYIVSLRIEATTAVRTILQGLPRATFPDQVWLIESSLQPRNTQLLLELRIADLAAVPERHRLVAAGFLDLIQSCSSATAVPPLAIDAATERMRSEIAARLLELIRGLPVGEQIGAAELEAMVHAVAGYLCIERQVLGRMEPLQLAANRALGRGAARKPDASDVSRFIRTPTAVMTLVTEIGFANRSDETTIWSESAKFRF